MSRWCLWIVACAAAAGVGCDEVIDASDVPCDPSLEVCGDNVDNTCNGEDERCPTTQPSLSVPGWACDSGSPPPSVLAWARIHDGHGFFKDGGCFVFFEGSPGDFYLKRTLERASASSRCEGSAGCTCPSLNGWPSYDRRLYAFTLEGDVQDCPGISIRDHAGQRQPVSNRCRKFLLQIHNNPVEATFVASGREAAEARLSRFSSVEVACVEDAPHRNLPFQSLLVADIQLNPGFVSAR